MSILNGLPVESLAICNYFSKCEDKTPDVQNLWDVKC